MTFILFNYCPFPIWNKQLAKLDYIYDTDLLLSQSSKTLFKNSKFRKHPYFEMTSIGIGKFQLQLYITYIFFFTNYLFLKTILYIQKNHIKNNKKIETSNRFEKIRN